ncbi:MAG: alpha-hydroxy-acid oxidizing protein [Alicyclobacillus sp.]|nr:alpha-hydroxy-acid oxidizing protein [Alicyclobacillus sp.]
MALDHGTYEWPITADEWAARARERLPDGPWWYLEGGAGLESTMRANREAFDRWRIRTRLLRDVENRDLGVTLFGRALPAPFLLGPVGVQSILHPDAELASARAAAAFGVPFVLSTVSSVPLEQVAIAMGEAPRWFQLYPGRDPEIITSLIQRAERAGYGALVVTVDTTMLGWRAHDLKNAYLPFLQGQGLANYLTDPVFRSRLSRAPEEDMAAAIQHFLAVYVNPGFTWEDLERIRAQTRLPLLVKGITHPEDVRHAFHLGADAVIVSNHGGRQVDGGVAALDALVEVREALGPDVTLLMDSGVRCAADVVKALALGARAVLFGRPYVYALAVGGEQGVRRFIQHSLAELDLQMALAGLRCVGEIDRSCVMAAR